VKTRIILKTFLPFLLFLSIILYIPAEEQSIYEFIAQLQTSLETRNLASYLASFSSDLRAKEEVRIQRIFDVLKMDSASIFKASKVQQTGNESSVYLQAFFQNSFSSVIETWNLSLFQIEGRWQIKEKNVVGDYSTLYKVEIPSDRIERAKLVEIEHADIKLSFKDAILFYDNVPNLETALLVLGDGHLHFSPSDPKEKHLLEMIYKKSFLEDTLKYAYLRFSNLFFEKNIKIEKESEKSNLPVSNARRNEAYSLFVKHYPRSFTVENSLNGKLFSILPQGDQAVIDFRGKKLGDLTYIYSPFSREQINLYRWKDEKVINLYSPVRDEQERMFFISFTQMFEVKRYSIDIDFDPSQSYLSGKANIEIESRVQTLDRVKLRFNPELDILRIYDQERRDLFYNQDKLRKYLYVYFVHPPPQNKPYSIEIYYRGKLVPQMETADAVSAGQIQYGERYDYTQYRFDTYFFSRRAFWYPAPPDDDYFNARLKIIVPPEYTCVSNGELVEQTRLNHVEEVERIGKRGSRVYTFETKYPLKYLSFIVGKFTKEKEDVESLPLRLYHSAFSLFQRRDLVEEAKDIIRFYETKFGPYPYEKLSIVRRSWPASGGHSPASFIVLNEFPRVPNGTHLISKRGPVDLSRWKEYYIAHEIAHQWWGQGVTWKTYHDQWLSEGLAQFAAVLYLKEKYGNRTFSDILKKFSQWTEKKSEWGPITLGSRIGFFDFDAYQTIVYNKPALVLNMLKDMIGEELFFKGLNEFFRRHQYGVASTYDFISIIEEISGKNLGDFFGNWFNSYVLPEVRVSQSVEKKSEGKYIMRLIISQAKDPFVFPLWIEWKENGERVEKKIIIDKRNKRFDFELRNKPKKIKINPNRAVPGKFF
jgi:hypothetical protein